MTLPSQPHLLTPKIIAHEIFGESADNITRVVAKNDLINLVGMDKARNILDIAFNIGNQPKSINSQENAIKPLTIALKNSGLLLNI